MTEDRQDEKKMEAMLQTYERKNQELEEMELEVRYRLQMLENTMPLLMLSNVWKTMSVQSTVHSTGDSTNEFSGDFDPVPQVPYNREEELIAKLKTLENKLNSQNRLLEESKSSEGELKDKLRDLEKLLVKEQSIAIDVEVDQDVELFEKLCKMAKERVEMVKRIKDLELKEKLYKETIEHADIFTAQLENNFCNSLKEKYLTDEAYRSHNGKYSPDFVSTGFLEEKVLCFDNELKRLRDNLCLIDKEKLKLEGALRKVVHELQEATNELENWRGEIEGPLKAKIEKSKERSRTIEDELSANYALKMDAGHVDTNEINANNLSFISSEKYKKDVKRMGLKQGKRPDIEAILRSYCEMTSNNGELPIFSKGTFDQEIISTKGEFRFTTSDDCTKENEDSVLLSQIISEDALDRNGENLMRIFSKCKNLIPTGLTDVTATQFQAFIAMVEQDEPQDVELPNISLKRDYPLSKPGLPEDCKVAQNAVTNLSGKDIKGTVDNLSRAYYHSKTCNSCNEKLGTFLEEIICQLGVKLPQVKEIGPGTVLWDANNNDAGYKIKHTVSSLMLAVEELEEKCRVKDTFIEAMAEELRSDGNFNVKQLMQDMTEYPSTDPPDFNRCILNQFLNCEPVDELGAVESPLKATNPLGLRVVRQVGPDSLLVEWNPPPANKVNAFELYVNGLFIQKIRSPGRTKTLLHPIVLEGKVTITLNTLSYTGQKINSAQVCYQS